jgi:two-component system chemotaxis sensor kinase CheA
MDDKLLAIFAEESNEIIDTLERGLLVLENSEDPEEINSVFRAAHTMKGNAGIVGYDVVVSLTHLMEGLLDEMRQGRMKPDSRVVGLLLNAVDELKLLVSSLLAGGQPAPPAEIIEALAACLGQAAPGKTQSAAPKQASPSPKSQSARFRITMRFKPDLFTTGTDPIQLLLELAELGQIEKVVCHDEELPPLERMVPDRLYLWWEVWLKSRQSLGTLANVFIFVQDDNHISIEEAPEESEALQAQKPGSGPQPLPTSAPQAPPPGPSPAAAPAPHIFTPPPTIRVDTDKLDKLVNLVGELAIGVARVNQLTDQDQDSPNHSELAGAVEMLDHISRDLQEQVMRARMIPVEGTFNRFQRVVRDLASELGKAIRLETSGSETELDKNVIEQIADPLKHLIRNSADHGLEPPEERLAAGKPETGAISLRAYQQEGQIIIEVADDGRGIDPKLILKKAREQGLAEPGASYAEKELFGFMFQPGFSTAATVTEVSGRGVGLDVVRQNIEALRGSIEVESQAGDGSTFRIRLPLTLAIIDGMMVRVGDEIITLPLLSILESIRPKAGEIKIVEGKGELISVRGEFLPLVRLHDVFNLPTKSTDPTQALVVIIESVAKRFGILVDDILGEQQAVIKSLEQNYQKVEGIAGATILGDGAVSLILDIHGLEKLAFG